MAGNVLYPVSPYPHVTPVGDMSMGGGAGGGGIGNLLAAISPPKINPGQVNPGTDAQGNPTFDVTPASIGGGFFNRLIAGRQGQMQVNQLNTQLQLARLNALAELAKVRQEGEETRKTLSSQQVTDLLKQHGLTDTTENRDYINNVFSKVQQQIEQAKAQNLLETEQSPSGQKAMTESNLGQMMMPAFAAQNASRVSAQPGETVAYNRAGNLMADRPDVLTGALSSSTQSTPMINPNFGKKGHENEPMYSVFPTGQSQMTAGGLQQQIDPSILQKAAGVQPYDPLMGSIFQQPQQGQPVIPQQPGISPPSNVPNKPLDTPTGAIGDNAFTGGGPFDVISWLRRQFNQPGITNNIGNSSTGVLTGY